MKDNKILKRIVSLILILIMVFGTIPSTIFAADGDDPGQTDPAGPTDPADPDPQDPDPPEPIEDVTIEPFWEDGEIYDQGEEIILYPSSWEDDPSSSFTADSVFLEGYEYQVYIKRVQRPVGGTYIYNNQDTSFTPQKADAGKRYVAVYGIKRIDEAGTEEIVKETDPETGQEKEIEVSRIISILAEPKRDPEKIVIKEFWDTNLYPSENTITLIPKEWTDDPLSAFDLDESVLWDDIYTYEPYIVSIVTPSGGTYVFSQGDTEFTPKKADEGKTYVVTYGVRKYGFDADGVRVEGSNKMRNINIAIPVPEVTERVRFNQVPTVNVFPGDEVHFMNEEWLGNPFSDTSIFEEGYTYEPFIVSVSSPQGASYTYKQGDEKFIPKDQDANKAYTVTYGVYRVKDGVKTIVDGVQTEGKIIVTGDRITKDRIEGDEVRVSRLTVEVYDGTDPFDANSYDGTNNRGNDSSKTNGVVRTFDSIDYKLKFSTESKDSSVNFKEGYMRFEVDIPLWSDQQAAFDFSSMTYMETGDSNPYKYEYYHYGIINGQKVKLTQDNVLLNEQGQEIDENGTVLSESELSTRTPADRTDTAALFKQKYQGTQGFGQHLNFYYHITQVEDSNGNINEAYPSTGTLPVVVNVLRMSNDDKINPTFKASIVEEEYEKEPLLDEDGNPVYDDDGEPVLTTVLDAKGNPVIKPPTRNADGSYNIKYLTENPEEDSEHPDWEHNIYAEAGTDSPTASSVKEVVVTCAPSYAIRLDWADWASSGSIQNYDFTKTVWTSDRLANFGVQPSDQRGYIGQEVYYGLDANGNKTYVHSVDAGGFNDNGTPVTKVIPYVAGDRGPNGQPVQKSQQNAPNQGAGNVYGRMATLGVALQLFNFSPDKGLRGIEFPKDGEPITFTIDLSSRFISNSTGAHDAATPLLWDAGGNHYEGVNYSPWSGRDVYGVKSEVNYAYRAAPYNYYTDNAINPKVGAAGRYNFSTTNPAYSDRVWWGGDWTVTQSGKTLSVTVKDFVINPNWFPVLDCGIENSNTGSHYYQNAVGPSNTNVGTFSAGEIHLVIPHGGTDADSNYAVQYGSGEMYYAAEFTGLNIISSSGQRFNLDMEKPTGDTRTGKIAPEGDDDYNEQNHPLYLPGGWTEQIWYTHKDNFVHANAPDRQRSIATVSLGADGITSLSNEMSDVATLGGKVGIIWRGNRTARGGAQPARSEFLIAKFDGSVLTPITNDPYRKPRIILTEGVADNDIGNSSSTTYNSNSQYYLEPVRTAAGDPARDLSTNAVRYKYYKEYDINGNVVARETAGKDGGRAVYSVYDPLNAAENTVFWYGYKRDGSNWTGQAEMSNTHKEDLIWVSSLDPSRGICVAIAAEVKDMLPGEAQTVDCIAYFDITDEYYSSKRTSFINPTLPNDGTSNAGYVASCEIDGNSWITAGSATPGSWSSDDAIVINHVSSAPETATAANGGMGLTVPLTDVPNKVNNPDWHGFEKADYTTGAYRTTEYMGATPYYRGDSLYLMPFNTTIVKRTMNQVYDRETGRWSYKNTWNLDNFEERIADFVLIPQFNTGGVIHEDDPAIVYIEDTLPYGMTYRSGSSVWISQVLDDKGYPVYRDTKGTKSEDDDSFFSVGNGEYYFLTGSVSSGFTNRGVDSSKLYTTANDEIVYDGKYKPDIEGLSGTYEGGQKGSAFEPVKIESLDGGLTRLTWEIHADNVGDFLPQIYYSADMQKEAGAFTKSLANTAIVTTDKEDIMTGSRENSRNRASSTLGNLATATVNLISPALIMTLKVPDKAVTAPGGILTYSIQYANANKDTDWDRAVMMDTLPTNNSELWKLQKVSNPNDPYYMDGNGTSYRSLVGTNVSNYNVYTLEKGEVPRIYGNLKYTLPTLQKARDKVYMKDYVFYYALVDPEDPVASRITAETLSTDYYNIAALTTDVNGNPIDTEDPKTGIMTPGLLNKNANDKSERVFIQTIYIDGEEHNITWYKAQNLDNGDPLNQHGVTISADGTVSGLDKLDVAAFFLYGTMKASTSIRVNMGIDTVGSQAGDIFTNLSSLEGNIGPADGRIIDRILSGTVWFDENKDGLRGNAETLFPDVTVVLERKGPNGWEEYHKAKIPKPLFDRNGNPFEIFDENGNQIYTVVDNGQKKTITDGSGNIVEVYDENGNPTYEFYENGSTTTTDENGYYEFRGLEGGEYRVIFKSTDGLFDISEYNTTIVDLNNQYKDSDGRIVSKDGQKDSDGIPYYDAQGKLTQAIIESYLKADENGNIVNKIVFPEDNEITTSPYRIDYQDLGLIIRSKPDKDLDEEQGVDESDAVTVGQNMPYRIYYKNDSASNYLDVEITDVIDKGLTVIESSISHKGKFYPDETGETGGTIVWRILRVPPNTTTAYVSFTGIVNGNALETGKIDNKATLKNNYYKDETPIPDGPPEPDPTGSVIVQHVTTDGTVLKPWEDVLRDVEVGTNYETSTEEFPGYRLVKVDTDNYDEPSGTVIDGLKRVVYVYEPIPGYTPPTGSVVVRHVDIYGNILDDWEDVLTDAEEGTSYSTHQNQYPGYEFVRVDDDPNAKDKIEGGEDYSPANGVVEADTVKHVTYVYKPKGEVGSVIVEHRAIKAEPRMVPLYDADGDIVFDQDNKPIMVQEVDETGKALWDPVLDEDGNYIVESILTPWEDVLRDEEVGTQYRTTSNDYPEYDLVTWDENYDTPNGTVEKNVTKRIVYLYAYNPEVGDVVVEHRAVKVNSAGQPIDENGNVTTDPSKFAYEKILAPWADVQKNQKEGTPYVTSAGTFSYTAEVPDPANPGNNKTVRRYYKVLELPAAGVTGGIDPRFDPASGTVEAGKVKHVVYLYVTTDPTTPPDEPDEKGSVQVKYVWEDEDGVEHDFTPEELSELGLVPGWNDVIKDGEPGTDYKTIKERFDGYTFERTYGDPVEGVVEADTTKQITYVYKKVTESDPDKQGSVVVRHIAIDDDGNIIEILKDWTDPFTDKAYDPDDESTISKHNAGDKYGTSQEYFEAPDGKKYVFVKVDDDPDAADKIDGGYDYSPASGTITADQIKHVTYIYKLYEEEEDPNGSVVVEHRSTTGEILKPWEDVVRDVPDGTPYTTNEETFKGYRFKEVSPDYDDPEGTVEQGKVKEVVYLYEPMLPGSGDVRVEHRAIKVDENGNPLRDENGNFVIDEDAPNSGILKPWEDVYKDVPAGSEYNTHSEYFDDYELVEVENVIEGGIDPHYDPASGRVEEGRVKSVVYLYKPKNPDTNPKLGDVVVEHRAVKLDEDGNPMKDEDGNYVIETILAPWETVKTGKSGEEYETSSRDDFTYVDADGETQEYELLMLDPSSDPASGEIEEGKTKHVIYLYVPKDKDNPPPEEPEENTGNVRVKYVWEDENGEIHEFTEEELKDTPWTTGENDVIIGGKDGTPYSTVKERIEGYTFTRTEGDPPTGEVEAGKDKLITYVYKKAPDPVGSVVEKHVVIDEDGNITEILVPETPVKDEDGRELKDVPDGDYKTTYLGGNPDESGDIYEAPDGTLYEKVKVEGEPEGSVEPGKTKEITYYYRKIPTGDVIVKHVAVDENGKVIKTLKGWEPALDAEDGSPVKGKPAGSKYTTDWLPSKEDENGNVITDEDGNPVYVDEYGNRYQRVRIDPDYDDPEGEVEANHEKRVVYVYRLVPGIPQDPDDPYEPPETDENTPPPTEEETPNVENPVPDKKYAEDTPTGMDGAPVKVGDIIGYEIFYGNADEEEYDEEGNLKKIEVVITDVIDEGLDVIRSTISDEGVYDEESRTITWTLSCDPGEYGSVRFRATVNETGRNKGKVENTATVKVGEHPEVKTRTLVNPVPDKKYAEDTPAGSDGVTVKLEDVIGYEITYGNEEKPAYDDEGNLKKVEVVITDVIDEGLDVIESTISDGGIYDEDSRTITWTLACDPGEYGSVKFRATVNETGQANRMVENTATVKVGNHPEVKTRMLVNPVEPPEPTPEDPPMEIEPPKPEDPPKPPEYPEPQKTPRTGDDNDVLPYILALLSSLLIACIYMRKKSL